MVKRVIILILLCLLVVPAYGLTMTDANNNVELESLDGPGGGGTLSNSDYILQDLKGAPFAGSSSDGDNDLLIGGIGALGEEGTEEGVPAGTVPLYISHDQLNIVVSWEAGYGDPQIWISIGDGSGTYTSEVSEWVKVVENGAVTGYDQGTYGTINVISSTQIEHENQYGDATGSIAEVYYKGLEAGEPDATLASAWAAGKINIEFPEDTFKLINIPFDLTLANVSNVLSDQLSEAKLQYNDNGLMQIVLSNGSWDQEIDLDIATGYWLKSTDQAAVCTFYGDVIRQTYSKQLLEGWDLYGYPKPLKVDSSAMGITPVDQDKLQKLEGSSLLQYTYDGQSGWDASFEIEGREGFWYKNPETSPRYLEATP